MWLKFLGFQSGLVFLVTSLHPEVLSGVAKSHHIGTIDAPIISVTQKITRVLGALYQEQETEVKHFLLMPQKSSYFQGKKLPIKTVKNNFQLAFIGYPLVSSYIY